MIRITSVRVLRLKTHILLKLIVFKFYNFFDFANLILTDRQSFCLIIWRIIFIIAKKSFLNVSFVLKLVLVFLDFSELCDQLYDQLPNFLFNYLQGMMRWCERPDQKCPNNAVHSTCPLYLSSTNTTDLRIRTYFTDLISLSGYLLGGISACKMLIT